MPVDVVGLFLYFHKKSIFSHINFLVMHSEGQNGDQSEIREISYFSLETFNWSSSIFSTSGNKIGIYVRSVECVDSAQNSRRSERQASLSTRSVDLGLNRFYFCRQSRQAVSLFFDAIKYNKFVHRRHILVHRSTLTCPMAVSLSTDFA